MPTVATSESGPANLTKILGGELVSLFSHVANCLGMLMLLIVKVFKLQVGASRSRFVGLSVGLSVGNWNILTIFDIEV